MEAAKKKPVGRIILGAAMVLAWIWGIHSCSGSEQPQATVPAPTAQGLMATVEQAQASGHFGQAKVVAATLLRKFPGTPEAAEVTKRLPDIDAGAAQESAANKAQLAEAAKKSEEARVASQAAAAADSIKAKAELAKLLRGFTKKHDEVRHITFYTPKNVGYEGVGSFFTLYLAVGDDGGAALHSRFQYGGDDWLFIEGMTVSVDGKTIPTIPFGFRSIERDNAAGKVWEWHDEVVQTDGIAPYLVMGTAKKVIIRFEGKTYYKDHVLSAAEKQAMLNMTEAYTILRQQKTQAL